MTLPELQAQIGARIRMARLAAGLRQRDLADATGSTQQHIALIEAGKVNMTIETLLRIGDALGVRVGALFDKA